MDSDDDMEPLTQSEDDNPLEESAEGNESEPDEEVQSENDTSANEETGAMEPEAVVETASGVEPINEVAETAEVVSETLLETESINEETEMAETMVETLLDEESNHGETGSTEHEEVTGKEVQPGPAEEVDSAAERDQEQTVEELPGENSSFTCEMFEEIVLDEGTADGNEIIGIERQDHGDSFVENFCGEIEIKEEELEIEQDELQSFMEDDPIMEMPAPIKQEDSDDDDELPIVQVKDNTRRKRKKKQSSSETETADEGEDCAGMMSSPIGEHAYHASKLKKKALKQKSYPIAASPYMARNVRNFLYTRNSTHTCLECQGQFFSVVQYLKHRKRHPKVENFPYQCRYCPSRFRLHRDMQPHLLTHSKLEKFTCPMCPTQMYSAHKLVKHMQVHLSNPKENYYFKCVTCSVRFSKCKQLEDHNLISHPKYINGVPVHPIVKTGFEPKNRTRTVHVCFHCGKVEGTWPELLIHMRIHKGPLACTICLLSIKTSDAFAEHVVKVHKDMGELTYHQCKNPACPREFISARELKQHEATCLPLGGEYRCEICDQLYREVDHFVTHMELHSMLSNELGHKMCPHCIFPTNDPGAYASHLVNHHGYRDRVETLEVIYKDFMRQEQITGSSAEDTDDDDDEENLPNEAEQEKKARHIDDDVVQVCE